MRPRAFVVLEQVVPAMRGSEARRRSRLACCSSPGPTEEQKARHTANAKAVQRSIWQRFWTGSKTTRISRVRRSLPKLAKRQARTPEVAVQSAFSALQSRKAALAKSQAKITELEAAAKQAAEAVEEAKQKAEKLQGEIDKLQTEYD